MATIGEVRKYVSALSVRRRSTSRDSVDGESMSSFHSAVVKKVAATGTPSPSRTT